VVEELRIVHIASEAVPVAKTGGLADVAGSLPAAQAAAGHEVALVVPCHRGRSGAPAGFEATGRRVVAGELELSVLRKRIHGVEYMLLDAPRLFERPGLYGARDGDYPDNPIRFAAFSRGAVRAALAELGRVDLFHCHDWQTAMVPQLLGRDPLLHGDGAGIPTLLTIHNLAYQGDFDPWAVEAANLPKELFTPLGFEFFGRVNYLKGGILAAGALSTVSPTYAREILVAEHGCGLHEVLGARRHLLEGILNGLDTLAWNPARDPHLPRSYTGRDVTSGKRACRRALAAELGLHDDETPMLGMVARLVHQKGADLVAGAAAELAGFGLRLALLGSGEPSLEEAFRRLAAAHPGRIAIRTSFDDPLAHRIYAGADLFLMPSRFEPCGLGQMIALRYGTLPVVNPVGGLADTVHDLDTDPGRGNGFHLHELSPAGLLQAVRRALRLLEAPRRLLQIRRRIMAEDHGWHRAVQRYDELYQRLTGQAGFRR